MDSIKPINIMVKFTAPEDRIVNEPSGVTDRVTEAEKRILNELIKDFNGKGIIIRVGNNKNGYWKIKK